MQDIVQSSQTCWVRGWVGVLPIVVIPDDHATSHRLHPGCGRSPKPADPEQYKLRAVVQELVSLLDALHVRMVHVVGHGMVCRCGAEFCYRDI